MRNILLKFKNIHFLWLVGVICFLTFYVPIKYFTYYAFYVPEWTLPIFVFSTMFPLWFNELLWRTASFASDSYIAFHDIHFEDRKWRKLTCNPFYFLSKYIGWIIGRPIFWGMTLLLVISLMFGYITDYSEFEFHPFFPFYIVNSIWWIGIIKEFVTFKNNAREGIINYRLPKD